MKKIVLTTEELNRIKAIREQFADITADLGNIEMQIMNLELGKDELKEKLKSLRTQELSVSKELKTTYGDGNISLETGEFTPYEEDTIVS